MELDKKKRDELSGKNKKLKKQAGRFPMVEDRETGRKIKKYRYNALSMQVFHVPVPQPGKPLQDVYEPTGKKNAAGEHEYEYKRTEKVTLLPEEGKKD